MGYNTWFDGSIEVKGATREQIALLKGLHATRRMKRKLPDEYGVEGEFYVSGSGHFGQEHEPNVLDYNRPPSTQPGLWLPWEFDDESSSLSIPDDGKHYYSIDWLVYLRDRVLKGCELFGTVIWFGEDREDFGRIEVIGNVIHVYRGRMKFEKESTL